MVVVLQEKSQVKINRDILYTMQLNHLIYKDTTNRTKFTKKETGAVTGYICCTFQRVLC